jgi:hypothetical protein
VVKLGKCVYVGSAICLYTCQVVTRVGHITKHLVRIHVASTAVTVILWRLIFDDVQYSRTNTYMYQHWNCDNHVRYDVDAGLPLRVADDVIANSSLSPDVCPSRVHDQDKLQECFEIQRIEQKLHI